MINRNNYHLIRAFLDFQVQVKQLGKASRRRYWSYLRHLLIWADDTPLCQVPERRPTFSSYLASCRTGRDKHPLASSTVKKIIQTVQRFFRWLLDHHPQDLRNFRRSWIDELTPPRTIQEPDEHQFVTLEELRLLLSIDPGDDLAMRRDQAAAAMLFLSGMRASAFVSLPIEAVVLEAGAIKQWPSLGVRTKNGKAATTYLLGIPDLREVVHKWDAFVRSQLPPSAAWYTPTVSQWGVQTLSADLPGKNRHIGLSKRLAKLFKAAGLPRQSPHKFRHGHAVYALQHAPTMADYKAVSMNLMHSDIRVTDSIYAPLAGDEVKNRIASLSGHDLASQPSYSGLADGLDDLTDDELAHILHLAASRLTA